MRIRYLSDSVVPSSSANSVHVMKMCQAFGRHGHDVVLTAYDGHGGSDAFAYYDVAATFGIEPIPHSRVPGVKRGLRALNGLRAARRRPRADLIYGRDLYSMCLAAQTGLPAVYEAHMAPVRRSDKLLTRALLARGNLRRLVVISQALADAFLAAFPGFPADKLLVAHDGADEPAAGEAAAADLPWPGRAGVAQVGYVGSLYPGKGSETVVALARRLPQLDFHVVGGAPADIERLRGEAAAPNLFLHGYVEHRRVVDYLRRMDVVLLPPQRRVMITSSIDIGAWMSPLKLFEYMAAKRPIVSSSLPVIEEVLTDGVNAVLVPADDLKAWADAVRRLAADADERAALAERAFRDFTGTYTWQARAGRVLEGL